MIVSPIFDSGLCIVGMVSSSWGDHARAASRFVAFDGKTGEVVWWAETPNLIRGIVERDSLACLGIDAEICQRPDHSDNDEPVHAEMQDFVSRAASPFLRRGAGSFIR